MMREDLSISVVRMHQIDQIGGRETNKTKNL